MGELTRMRWPTSTLLDLLNDAEQRPETFDMASMDLSSGKQYMVAVVCGPKAEEAFRLLQELKNGGE